MKNVSSGKLYRLTIETNTGRSVYFNITNIFNRTDSDSTWLYGFKGASQDLPQLLSGSTKASITIHEIS